ncbi:hypothetical protein BDV95DRAFT_596149 [Massariosphaeria phaeospora]|uniref:Replication protein A C-terminal domain-containing protein n=1 Tax=Massariosphaeria phaeospora TaxID=100035 RepID=A0A7C8I3F8_9PLEO|nr:hypothetical protein BDV95DRAFT_596149 [Massariosphaeria phaeospora]
MSYQNNYDTTSYNNYGGGGGGGGGGFMPGEGSQNSPSGGRKEYKDDSLRPVTIKQILDAQAMGEEFKIDNTVISHLTFVGQIRNISKQATNITYKLDDGTGSIEVKQWVDSESVEQTNPATVRLIEGIYCRAWGKLKSFHDRKHVGAQIIRPVEDHNEVSYHLLEATAIHLYLTRGPPGGASGASAVAVNGGNQQQQAAGIGHNAYSLASYSAVAQRVYEHLRQAPQSNEGLHSQDIAAKLGIDTGDMTTAGDELLNGGLIYTTVDDQTWALLEAD